MITFCEVSIGSGETASCASCAFAQPAATFRPASEVLAEVSRLITGWNGGPGPNVAFAGPEPFAHPELPLLVQGAAEAGCERIRLRTDAGALSASGNAAGALAAGVRHIEWVLLAGDAAAHDALTGRPGLFDAAHAGVTAFREAAQQAGTAVAITGVVPLCRHNRDHLLSAVQVLAAAGAVSVSVEPRAGFRPDAALLAAAAQAAIVNGIWLHGPGVSGIDAAPWLRCEAPR